MTSCSQDAIEIDADAHSGTFPNDTDADDRVDNKVYFG